MKPAQLLRRIVLPLLAALALGVHAAPAGGIAWVQAAGDAEVDAAFARARAEAKPVFVYWGAKWCPPCNQLQATLFNRQAFIERTRAFVAVYVDGDRPGAQKLGERFRVRGYPTLVLFDARGRELTRLPGEVDAEQVTELLTLGMSARRSAAELLADLRADPRRLTSADWRLLAFHSWETDPQRLAGTAGTAGTAALLRELAEACPAQPPEIAARLWLKALAAADAQRAPVADAARRRPAVLALLADAARVRRHMDVLSNAAPELVQALSAAATPQRAALAAALDAALRGLQLDASLSRADRVGALIGRLQLARLDAAGAVPEPLHAELRDMSAAFDREIRDGYERQAVIGSLAWALRQAGALDESDALLKANLARSHSPYYLMAGLAANARARGDTAAALGWRRRAFERSEGGATRLQWGASYLGALVDDAPQDAAAIETLAAQLIGEAARLPDAFEARAGGSMKRIGERLQAWSAEGGHEAVLTRLQRRLDPLCARLAAQSAARQACEAVLKPAQRAAGLPPDRRSS